MPGKAWTGATAQMAPSRGFIGLQEIRHTDIHPGRVQAVYPLLDIRPRHSLVCKPQEMCQRLFGVANIRDNLIVHW